MTEFTVAKLRFSWAAFSMRWGDLNNRPTINLTSLSQSDAFEDGRIQGFRGAVFGRSIYPAALKLG